VARRSQRRGGGALDLVTPEACGPGLLDQRASHAHHRRTKSGRRRRARHETGAARIRHAGAMTHDARDDAPLAGIVVADLSRVLAGPPVGATLADLGARVIKVEQPGTGDGTRSWSPPASATGSTYFDSANRGKESVALDLADPGDLALARE